MDPRSSGSGDRDALVLALRKLRPAKVRAIVDADTARDVAVPGSQRHRWQTVARVLASFQWQRVEALDKSGALLGVIEGDHEEDPIVPAVDMMPAAGLDREHGLLTLMLKAQEVALRSQAGAMATLVDGYKALAETMFARLSSHEAALDKVLSLAHQAATRVATGGAADEDPTDKLMLQVLQGAGLGGVDEAKLGKLVDGAVEKAAKKLLNPAPNGAAAKGA